MICIKSGCKNDAIGRSNYCVKHQPNDDGIVMRRYSADSAKSGRFSTRKDVKSKKDKRDDK